MILAGNPLSHFYLSNLDFTPRRSNKSPNLLLGSFTIHRYTSQLILLNQTINLLTTFVARFLASPSLPSPKPPRQPTTSFNNAVRVERNHLSIVCKTSSCPTFKPYLLFRTVEISLDIFTLINISPWPRRPRSRSIYKKS